MFAILSIVYIVSTIISFFGLAFRDDCQHLYEDDLESTMLVFCPVVNTWAAWYVLRKTYGG